MSKYSFLSRSTVLTAFAWVCFFSTSSFAQVKYGNDGEIESAEIIIEKDRKIELPEANRNFEKIPTTVPTPARRQQDYDYAEKNFRIGDLKFSPRVLQLPQEPLSKLYGNYVKLGVGNYGTINAEGYFNTKRTDDYAYGLRVKHLSSWNGPVDKKNSGTSANMLGFYGKYFTEMATLSADVQYNRDKYYFYGYKPGSVSSEKRDSIKQIFNTISFEGRITNSQKSSERDNSPVDYDFTTRFTNLKDNYSASEFDWTTHFKGSKVINEDFKAFLNADLSLTKRKDTKGDLSRNLFRFRPSVQWKYEDLTIRGSLNIVYENDTISTAKTIHLYPTVDASYQLSENVSAFAGLDGDVQQTTLRQFVQDNPYLVANVPLAHTNKLTEMYGGLRGKANRDITFELRVSGAKYRNLYFFNNSKTDTSKFTILYDKGISSVLNLTGQVTYNTSEHFRSSLKLDLYNYTLPQVQTAWHRPTFTATWLNTFNVRQKVFFNANFYYLGGIEGKNTFTDKSKKIDPIVDLSLKVDYLISNNFSSFLSINNIFAQKYQRYLYYPQQGLNILVGLTYSF
ncbi:MAG: TonB-dependent receptor [Bacteroidota bacterium]